MAGQTWTPAASGSYMYSGELSMVLRNAKQPLTRFVEHCDPDDFTNKGLHVGKDFQWDIYSDVATQGGRLQENQKMPETGFTITQGSGTVYEFGNSVPFTERLDNGSAHPLKKIIRKSLKNDCVKAFETEARAQFASTVKVFAPASGNSATDITLSAATYTGSETVHPTVTNNLAMNNAHVKKIVDEMAEENTPTWDDGNYRCIGRPKTFRQFKDDLETISSYTGEGFQNILNGEVGRHYEGVRFFTQTAIANQSWTNGKSDEAYFFGEDTVIEAIVVPPEIRGKLGMDYGRDQGVAWYAEEGFKLVHQNAANCRIYKWASAA